MLNLVDDLGLCNSPVIDAVVIHEPLEAGAEVGVADADVSVGAGVECLVVFLGVLLFDAVHVELDLARIRGAVAVEDDGEMVPLVIAKVG